MNSGRTLTAFMDSVIKSETAESMATVDFACADGVHRRFASDELSFGGNNYIDDLTNVSDIEQSEDGGTDRLTVTLQNATKSNGILVKNKKFDFADVSLGTLYRKNGNVEWVEDFFGVAIPKSVDQTKVEIEIVDDMVAAGFCISVWTLACRCHLIFKSLECGYVGLKTICDHLLKGDCTANERTHRFVGGTTVILKNDQPPASPSVIGGGSGGSGGSGGWNQCFAGETAATLADGMKYELRFLYANKDRFIGELCRSFDAENNRVSGIITNIFKSTARKLAHVRFSGDADVTRVKPNHKYWTENLEFVEAQKLEIGQKVWSDERFAELAALESYELIDYPEGEEVFNLTVSDYAAWVANGKRVSNSKGPGMEEGGVF